MADQPTYQRRAVEPVAASLTTLGDAARAAAGLDLRLAEIAPAVQRGVGLADVEAEELRRELVAVEKQIRRIQDAETFPDGRRPVALERDLGTISLGNPIHDFQRRGEEAAVQEECAAAERAGAALGADATAAERQALAERLIKAESRRARLG